MSTEYYTPEEILPVYLLVIVFPLLDFPFFLA